MLRWVSPFGYPRIKAWSAAPRGFSQPPTSFIGFRRQGIHRWLFVAWRTKMLVLAMEFSRGFDRAVNTAVLGRNDKWPAGGLALPVLLSLLGAALLENGTETARSLAIRELEVETFHSAGCLASRIASASTGSRRTLCCQSSTGPSRKLLRKEVIQPHLPVRLPCYDFTPITDPTFDSSLLAVGPLASGVTDFRGVTGGVYKARERIHPGVADPGLLATPTSWSRVADSNPN